MKITLDHNCLINVANKNEIGAQVERIVESRNTQCFIVNIGASEMREKGIRPDRYDLFEDFLVSIGFSDLPRIDPILVWDLTFWDKCVWASEEIENLQSKIGEILFPVALEEIKSDEGLDTSLGKKWINRLCDIQSIWCHINNNNDIFLTSDKNFMKQTKLPALINIGAKSIKMPSEVNV